MPISDAHAGRTYPSTAPYVVGRAKIEEFAAALGDENPAYAGPDAVAPPTFAAVLAAKAWDALFGDPELDIELRRTIHTDQRFAWARPLRSGDEVTATLTVDKVRTRGASAWITLSVLLATTEGEALCTATSNLLHTWPEEESA